MPTHISLAVSLALLAACTGAGADDDGGSAGTGGRPESAGGSGGGGGAGGSGGGGGDPGDCTEPTGRGPSQRCCPAHGPDACGAGLFCAAFDGRREATCYAERSRMAGQECGGDLHCVSGSCNLTAGKCRALAGTACDVEVGCAPAPSGDRYVCDARDGTPECAPVGTGELGELCENDGDCDVGSCTDNVCWTSGFCSDDPRGPCSRGETKACNDCRRLLIDWCTFHGCEAASGPLSRCQDEQGCGPPIDDYSCGLEACRKEYCELVACAELSCREYEVCD